MQSYFLQQYHVATETEAIVSLKSLTSQDLIKEVYINNTLLDPTLYETMESQVTFLTPLEKGDVVAITIEKQANGNLQILSFGRRDSVNAIFKRFDSGKKIKSNNRYNIQLRIKDQAIEWAFSTKLTPMFSHVKKILEDVGEFIQGFTEEYINSLIHQNSISLMQKIDDAKKAGATISIVVTQDQSTEEYSSTSKAIYNWVRYKTDIDLIYARYYGISGEFGAETKTLGDLSIQKSIYLPLIDKMVEELKKRLTLAEQSILGSSSIAKGFVKASTSYPYDVRDIFTS